MVDSDKPRRIRERLAAETNQPQVPWMIGEQLADLRVTTWDDAKAAIELARLRRMAIASEKRECAAQLAFVRAELRRRQAAPQEMRNVFNQFSDRQQHLNQQIRDLDRLIRWLQRGDWATPP